MDDQVSQNARVEAAEQARRWGELTRQEQAAALTGLAEYLTTRQDLANALAARNQAFVIAGRLFPGQPGESPIRWPALTDQERGQLLQEVAIETRTLDGKLADYSLDLAEQLERQRTRTRGDRDR
jgi:hypothetical protein